MYCNFRDYAHYLPEYITAARWRDEHDNLSDWAFISRPKITYYQQSTVWPTGKIQTQGEPHAYNR